jgi:hypothetical protein
MPFRRNARRVLDPIVEFLRIEAVGGTVLLAATIAALALTNSPLADTYQRLWQQPLTVGSLTWDLRHWVNDALMTIFFLVIGLEVKRELTIGRLRDPRRASLPIMAALAGALVPALVFLAFNPAGRRQGVPARPGRGRRHRRGHRDRDRLHQPARSRVAGRGRGRGAGRGAAAALGRPPGAGLGAAGAARGRGVVGSLPVFALANAGVVLDAEGLSAAWGNRVAWGGWERWPGSASP